MLCGTVIFVAPSPRLRGGFYIAGAREGQRRSAQIRNLSAPCCARATSPVALFLAADYFLRNVSSATTSAPLRSALLAGAAGDSICLVALSAGGLACSSSSLASNCRPNFTEGSAKAVSAEKGIV